MRSWRQTDDEQISIRKAPLRNFTQIHHLKDKVYKGKFDEFTDKLAKLLIELNINTYEK